MMDRTDRHYRYFMRQITRRTLLYTEMITTTAILHGDREYLLRYSPQERPLALQLGGSDPVDLAQCAVIAQDMGYDEVNLNVGCPSSRVQNACWGVALMRHPERVAEGVAAMRAAVSIPVTVKHRIGVDELDRYEDLANFVSVVSQSGCQRFTVHARKAWLNGINPKQNRNIPPLRHDDVRRLKRDFEHLQIEINGGFTSLEMAHAELQHVDAVMIGRFAYQDPYAFAAADRLFFGDERAPRSRAEVVEAMHAYLTDELARGGRVHCVTRHMLQLYNGQPGARAWRRHLGDPSNHQPSLLSSMPSPSNRIGAAGDSTQRSALSNGSET